MLNLSSLKIHVNVNLIVQMFFHETEIDSSCCSMDILMNKSNRKTPLILCVDFKYDQL